MQNIKETINRFEHMQTKAPEWGAFLLYFISHIVLSAYHENWYDECVAWMIAKYTSVKDILFYVPHYEGHPPLWHLILKVFSMVGVNFHVALSIVVISFSSAAVYLILFYAPFPRTIRLALPFTYFIFYQYGVISRPYCVMMLAFFLMALSFQDKDNKPKAFILSSILLCLSSAYGIVITFGLFVVWMFEILKEKYDRDELTLRKLVSDNRVIGMIITGIVALVIVYLISPRNNTYAITNITTKFTFEDFIRRIIYIFFCMIPDTFCYDVFSSKGADLYIVAFWGVILLVYVFMWGRKKKTLFWFFVPYFIFSLFSSVIYLYRHHTGIIGIFFIFWCWISYKNDSDLKQDKYGVITNPSVNIAEAKGLLIYTVLTYAMIVSIYYSICSSTNDLRYSYSSGKDIASFIKSYGLTDYRIMADWTDEESCFNMQISNAYIINPYFENNIFDYYSYGSDGKYTLHVVMTEEEENRLIEKWNEIGPPDIFIGKSNLSKIFGNDVYLDNNYIYVFCDLAHVSWKSSIDNTAIGIYIKKDIADKLGLKEVSRPVIISDL